MEMEGETRLRGRRLVLARVVWLALVVTTLLAYSVVTIGNISAPVTICDAANCTMSVAQAATWRAAGLTPELGNLLSQLASSLAMLLGFVLIAALIAWRRSDDWMALLVSFALIAWGPYVLNGTNLALSTRPGWQLVSQVLLASATLAFTSLFYLFPDGRFVPRWSRYLLAAFGVVWLVGTALNTREILEGTYQGGRHSTPAEVVEILLTLVLLLGGVAAQAWRYARVSDAAQRQQTKWVVLGLGGPILTLVLWFSVFSRPDILPARMGVFFLVVSPLMTLIGLALPASVGIAILRYRLWDIDILIRRTLVYSTLTAILALFYFGSVVVLQQLLHGLTGQRLEGVPAGGSDLAIILSTLGIAALFNPLRARVQNVIDRRFYRRKYDAQKILARFGTTVRDEVDLQRLTDELLTVVGDTMQPAQASLWLRGVEQGKKTGRGT